MTASTNTSKVSEAELQQVREKMKETFPPKLVAVARCANCLFWRATECHRFPPIAAIWPETDANTWCGEWKSK